MPRAPSDKVPKAEKLYRTGMPLAEIAVKTGVPLNTVRSWRSRYGWKKTDKSKKDGTFSRDKKKTQKKDAKGPEEKDAKKGRNKCGAPVGNRNALGNRGNPNPVPTSNYKHGGYAAVYWDTLDEEERELLGSGSRDEELILSEQIDLFTIRERRLMKAVNKCRSSGDVDAGNSIVRLESELSNVQAKKTKAIETLVKLRLGKQKLETEDKNDDALQVWIETMQAKTGDMDDRQGSP